MKANAIDQAHVDSVCRIGQGAQTCAFLTLRAEGFACAKGTSIEPIIRERLAAGSMNATGDNCTGWPPSVCTCWGEPWCTHKEGKHD